LKGRAIEVPKQSYTKTINNYISLPFRGRFRGGI
jgi:hypothetical protein